MTQQTVEQQRISENPDNYASVFASSRAAADDTHAGRLEPGEAKAVATNNANAQRALDGDLKARLAEHRLAAKRVNNPQVTGPSSGQAA